MSAQPNRFGEFLKHRIGLDPGSIGEAAIQRAVRVRSAAKGVADDAAYWACLLTQPSEVQALIEAVVVPETWFHRYPESLTALVDLVRERLARQSVVRILSLPCSTGEEPYSIAMSLLDAGVATDQVVIDAVDISEKVVDFARQAVYRSNSFRGEAQGLLRDRYFTPTDRGHALSPIVTSRVRFQQGNLFDPGLLAGAPPYDVVFCRNLLIYFDTPTQERAVSVLTRLARPDGLMFVGPAEASLLTRRGLPSIGRAHAFAFSLARAVPAAPPGQAGRPWLAGDRSLATRSSILATAPVSARRPDPLARITPPGRAPAPTAIQARGASSASSASSASGASEAATELQRLADLGRVDEALMACERWLATNGPTADAYYFQGLLHDAAGRAPLAQAGYRKALYLEPKHRRALLQLSALLESRGDLEGARRMKARARRQEREHG